MSNISITKEEFDILFPGKESVWHLLTTKPRTKEELLYKYFPSKLWRLNNVYTIIDKDGEPCTFRMNRSQFVVYAHKYLHWRLIILKSRQQGISTLYLIDYFDDAMVLPNLKCGLMAQDIDAAKPLLERVKYTWDKFDPIFKDFLNIRIASSNASEFSFTNHSQMLIRTSFRSATLQRLHISELGKIANKYPQKAKETNTGTLQTISPGNYVGIESTAEGANMYKQKWDAAMKLKIAGIPEINEDTPVFQKLWAPEFMHSNIAQPAAKDFYPVFLSWLYDPDCVEFVDQIPSDSATRYFDELESTTGQKLSRYQKNFWLAQERELEGDIHQEYPATPEEAFTAAKDGTYWAKLYIEHIVRKNRKLPKIYDPNLPVYCCMDLGKNDFNVLAFFQYWVETTGKPSLRFIAEYKNHGEGIEHYANYLKATEEFENSPTKDWEIIEIGLPHDAAVSDLSISGSKTRQDIYYDNGIRNTIILDKMGVNTSIELVREWIPNMTIDSSCDYLVQCFLGYTKKWDPVLEIWKKEPTRNEYAHGADAIRYSVQYAVEYLVGSEVKTKNSVNKRKRPHSKGSISL